MLVEEAFSVVTFVYSLGILIIIPGQHINPLLQLFLVPFEVVLVVPHLFDGHLHLVYQHRLALVVLLELVVVVQVCLALLSTSLAL